MAALTETFLYARHQSGTLSQVPQAVTLECSLFFISHTQESPGHDILPLKYFSNLSPLSIVPIQAFLSGSPKWVSLLSLLCPLNPFSTH